MLQFTKTELQVEAKAAKKRDKSVNKDAAKVFQCEHCGGWHYLGSR